MLKACLNGNRQPGSHPELPVSPDELARDAVRVVNAGAYRWQAFNLIAGFDGKRGFYMYSQTIFSACQDSRAKVCFILSHLKF